jgi:glycosyltransferase involved in cell wall biosynthesis
MHDPVARRREKSRLFFDVSGLLQWFAYQAKPTGIQRVTTQILHAATTHLEREVELIARCPGSRAFFPVSRQLATNLVGPARDEALRSVRRVFVNGMRSVHPLLFLRQARMGHVPYALWGISRLTEVARNRSPLRSMDLQSQHVVIPAADDVIVGLGDFWCHREHANALVDIKRRTGATLIHMIHDLYALSHPEWTHPYYGPQFAKQFAWLAPHVDHWLTNSRFVKSQVNSYVEEHRIAGRRIDVVPMGWDSFPDASTLLDDKRVMEKLGLDTGKYILHVGTVEPRKNLLSLIDVMCKLRRELGDETPTCILVGREGWRSDEVKKHLRRTAFAGGTIRWIHEVDDADLPLIYRGARFTVMPSLAEGWGLTVQESLAHGVPCIASDAGGVPEAGLDLARYVNPRSSGELFAAIRHWATDDEAVSSARTRIRVRLERQSSRPTWKNAAQTVFGVCEKATLIPAQTQSGWPPPARSFERTRTW